MDDEFETTKEKPRFNICLTPLRLRQEKRKKGKNVKNKKYEERDKSIWCILISGPSNPLPLHPYTDPMIILDDSHMVMGGCGKE